MRDNSPQAAIRLFVILYGNAQKNSHFNRAKPVPRLLFIPNGCVLYEKLVLLYALISVCNQYEDLTIA